MSHNYLKVSWLTKGCFEKPFSADETKSLSMTLTQEFNKESRRVRNTAPVVVKADKTVKIHKKYGCWVPRPVCGVSADC